MSYIWFSNTCVLDKLHGLNGLIEIEGIDLIGIHEKNAFNAADK